MQKVKLGAWIIVNLGVAFFLSRLVAAGCWLYYFENRMPADAGYVGQTQLTMSEVSRDILKASACSAVFAAFIAYTALYIHKVVWATSVKNRFKDLGLWLSIVNWVIIFFGSVGQSYQFFVERSRYF